MARKRDPGPGRGHAGSGPGRQDPRVPQQQALPLSVAGHLLLGRHHVLSDPQSPLWPRKGSNRSATFNGIAAKAHSTGFLSAAPAAPSPSLCEGPFSNSDGMSGRGTPVLLGKQTKGLCLPVGEETPSAAASGICRAQRTSFRGYERRWGSKPTRGASANHTKEGRGQRASGGGSPNWNVVPFRSPRDPSSSRPPFPIRRGANTSGVTGLL